MRVVGYMLRLVSSDPFDTQVALDLTGKPTYSRLVCEGCLESAISSLAEHTRDIPSTVLDHDDPDSATCTACDSEIASAELYVEVRRVRLSGGPGEIEGCLCLKCAHLAGDILEDADLSDLKAPGCCLECTDDCCWRVHFRDEPACTCPCHGQTEEGEEEYEHPFDSDSDVSFDPL